ncbi:hypothetical protein SAY86_031129 [Trapa natans]|uniref:Uncharacterized protein n=1 Tax=Trapa natans TaxID=22666 RepID=A0AAN7MTQ1_TRANT|nr:hypothetical protein SAY86_031129 [Trapa natans]
MPKKKSLKTQKDGQDEVVVESETSTGVKKPKDEIDEIFASKKRKRREQEKVEKHSGTDLKPKKMKNKMKERGRISEFWQRSSNDFHGD